MTQCHRAKGPCPDDRLVLDTAKWGAAIHDNRQSPHAGLGEYNRQTLFPYLQSHSFSLGLGATAECAIVKPRCLRSRSSSSQLCALSR